MRRGGKWLLLSEQPKIFWQKQESHRKEKKGGKRGQGNTIQGKRKWTLHLFLYVEQYSILNKLISLKHHLNRRYLSIPKERGSNMQPSVRVVKKSIALKLTVTFAPQ